MMTIKQTTFVQSNTTKFTLINPIALIRTPYCSLQLGHFQACQYKEHTARYGGTVGSSSALQAGMSRVRFPIVSLEFIDIILPAALWYWDRLSL